MSNNMIRGLTDFNLPTTPKGARLIQFDNSGRAVVESVRASAERNKYLERQRAMSEQQRVRRANGSGKVEETVRPLMELLRLVDEAERV